MPVRRLITIAAASALAFLSVLPAQADPRNSHAQGHTASTAPVSIVLYGDSITQGLAAHPTWRYRLWQGLRAGGNDVHFVGPEQTVWNGYATDSTEYRFSNFDQSSAALAGMKFMTPAWTVADVATTYHPDVIVGLIGINDLMHGTAPETLAANWRAQIDAAREADPHASFVLVQYGQTWWPHVADYNALLTDIASDMDHPHSRVLVATAPTLDMWTDTHDGLHLTPSGELKVAQSVETALAQLGLPSGTPAADPDDAGVWVAAPGLTATPSTLTVAWTSVDYATSEDVYVRDETAGTNAVLRFRTGTSLTLPAVAGHTYDVWLAPDFIWAQVGTTSTVAHITTPTS